MVTVIYGVKGARRTHRKYFSTLDDAMDFAARWCRSNSIGSYFAKIRSEP